MESKKVCRHWDGEEETPREKQNEREREKERGEQTKAMGRFFASARRAWPATAAEVVKRLVLTTSAACC